MQEKKAPVSASKYALFRPTQIRCQRFRIPLARKVEVEWRWLAKPRKARKKQSPLGSVELATIKWRRVSHRELAQITHHIAFGANAGVQDQAGDACLPQQETACVVIGF
jgi:hypothetical protein